MADIISQEKMCEESTLTLAVSIELAQSVFKKVASKDMGESVDSSMLYSDTLTQAISSQLRKSIASA